LPLFLCLYVLNKGEKSEVNIFFSFTFLWNPRPPSKEAGAMRKAKVYIL